MPRYQVDIAPVEQTNAALLVVHHLAIAAGYFQSVPEDNEREALMAQVAERFQGFGIEEAAATAFVDAICSQYDALKDED